MNRGAKIGDNRFKNFQEHFVNKRLARLNNIVIPKLKIISADANIDNISRFSRIVCNLYNEDLPSNEKKLSLRTVTNNPLYWSALSDIYNRNHSQIKQNNEFKNTAINDISISEIDELKEQISRLKMENRALKSAFPNFEKNKVSQAQPSHDLVDIDNLCRLIHAIIEDLDGVFIVDTVEGTIHNQANDHEKHFGILPKDVIKPYITWLRERQLLLETQ